MNSTVITVGVFRLTTSPVLHTCQRVLVRPPLLWPADNSGGDGNDDALVGCGDGGGSCSSDGGSRVNGGDDGGGSGGVALPAKAAILTWAVARCCAMTCCIICICMPTT